VKTVTPKTLTELKASVMGCKEGMARVFAVMVGCLWVRAASRYKFYRSREFITGYKTDGEHWSSIAVQGISEPEIYHGAGIRLQANARVPM